jgi:hypothetical protein
LPKKRIFRIYTVKFNGSIKYVGITKHKLNIRVNQHKCEAFSRNSQNLLHKAMRKYSDFEFKQFASTFSWKEACELEIELIKMLKTYVKSGGYNLTLGGDGCSQHTRSPEWRKQKSISQKAKGPFFKGKTHTEETKKLISQKKKGISAEYLKKPIVDQNGNYYDSATDASKILGIKRKTIQESIKRNGTLRCGLKFAYAEVNHP